METLEQLAIIGIKTLAQAEAISLHYEIVAAAQTAANSLLDLGRKLKRMRDSSRYKDLGYQDFAEYTERAVGIRQRQAYKYIGVVEKLPAQLIEENAAAGITKLELLARLGPIDQEEVAGDLAHITVAELQKLIDEKNGLTEQLTMLQEATADTVEAEAREVDAEADLAQVKIQARAEALEETARQYREELAQAKAAQAAAVAKAQAAAENAAAKKIKQAKKEAEDRATKSIEKAKAEAAAAAQKEQEEKDKAAVERARQEAQQARQRAEELAKQMKLQGSAEGVKFALLFDDLQQKALAIMEMVDGMAKEGKAEEAERFSAALFRALRALADQAACPRAANTRKANGA